MALPPAAQLNQPVYRHASGVHSSRKRTRAADGLLTFRYAATNIHLDHNALAAFRRGTARRQLPTPPGSPEPYRAARGAG
ncbi:MAG TPA: hypothetical protein PK238_10760, partial [Giesbergeria sp.]|nr:hypothetical protein [Giesbergeria sp.]